MNGSVPAQELAIADMGKSVSDLVDRSARVAWTGTSGRAVGGVKCIAEAWKEFSQDGGNTGHFFPIMLAESLVGKKCTIKGRADGDRTVTIDDRLMITRIENLAEGMKPTLEFEGGPTLSIDFSKAELLLPTGRDAFDEAKADFGGFGKNTDYYDGGRLEAAWSGTRCVLKGKLKKVSQEGHDRLSADGHYFAFGLRHEWFDGKDVTVRLSSENTARDTDFVISVTEDSKKNPLTVRCGGQLIAEFDLGALELLEQ